MTDATRPNTPLAYEHEHEQRRHPQRKRNVGRAGRRSKSLSRHHHATDDTLYGNGSPQWPLHSPIYNRAESDVNPHGKGQHQPEHVSGIRKPRDATPGSRWGTVRFAHVGSSSSGEDGGYPPAARDNPGSLGAHDFGYASGIQKTSSGAARNLHSSGGNAHSYHPRSRCYSHPNASYDPQYTRRQSRDVGAENRRLSRQTRDFSFQQPGPHEQFHSQPHHTLGLSHVHQQYSTQAHATYQQRTRPKQNFGLRKGTKRRHSLHTPTGPHDPPASDLLNFSPDSGKPFNPSQHMDIPNQSPSSNMKPSDTLTSFPTNPHRPAPTNRQPTGQREIKKPASILKRNDSPRHAAQYPSHGQHLSALPRHDFKQTPGHSSGCPHLHPSQAPPDPRAHRCSCSTLSTPDSQDSQYDIDEVAKRKALDGMAKVKREQASPQTGIWDRELQSGVTYDLVSDGDGDVDGDIQVTGAAKRVFVVPDDAEGRGERVKRQRRAGASRENAIDLSASDRGDTGRRDGGNGQKQELGRSATQTRTRNESALKRPLQRQRLQKASPNGGAGIILRSPESGGSSSKKASDTGVAYYGVPDRFSRPIRRPENGGGYFFDEGSPKTGDMGSERSRSRSRSQSNSFKVDKGSKNSPPRASGHGNPVVNADKIGDVEMTDASRHGATDFQGSTLSASPREPSHPLQMDLEQQQQSDEMERFLQAALQSDCASPSALEGSSPRMNGETSAAGTARIDGLEQNGLTTQQRDATVGELTEDARLDSLFVEDGSEAQIGPDQNLESIQGSEVSRYGRNQSERIDSLFVGSESDVQERPNHGSGEMQTPEANMLRVTSNHQPDSRFSGAHSDIQDSKDRCEASRQILDRITCTSHPEANGWVDGFDRYGHGSRNQAFFPATGHGDAQSDQQPRHSMPTKLQDRLRQLDGAVIRPQAQIQKLNTSDPRCNTPNNLFGINDVSKLPVQENSGIRLSNEPNPGNMQAPSSPGFKLDFVPSSSGPGPRDPQFECSDQEMRDKKVRLRELEEKKAAKDRELAKRKARADIDARVEQLEKEVGRPTKPEGVAKVDQEDESKANGGIPDGELEHLKLLCRFSNVDNEDDDDSTQHGTPRDGAIKKNRRIRSISPQNIQQPRRNPSPQLNALARPSRGRKRGLLGKIAGRASKEAEAHARRTAYRDFLHQNVFADDTKASSNGKDQKEITETTSPDAKYIRRRRDDGAPIPLNKVTEDDRLLIHLRTDGHQKRSWKETTALWKKMTGKSRTTSGLSKRFSRLQKTFQDLNEVPMGEDQDKNTPSPSLPDMPTSQSSHAEMNPKDVFHPPEPTADLVSCLDPAQDEPEQEPRPTTSGKTLTPALARRIMAQLEMDKIYEQEVEESSEEESDPNEVEEREASPITDLDFCHYIYQVIRSTDRGDDGQESCRRLECGPQFTSIWRANAEAAEEFRRERGPIEFWPLKSFRYETDINGLSHWLGTSDNGTKLNVFVERSLRAFKEGILPESKDGWLGRKIFLVYRKTIILEAADGEIQDTERPPQGPPGHCSSENEDDQPQSNPATSREPEEGDFDELFEEACDAIMPAKKKINPQSGRQQESSSTSGQITSLKAHSNRIQYESVLPITPGFTACAMANNQARELYWGLQQSGAPRSARYDVVNAQLVAQRALVEEVAELNANGEKFDKTIEVGEQTISIYVEEAELLGPRNI